MSAKKIPAPKKTLWGTTRAPFTWHLHPPFDKKFDKYHWWENSSESDIDPHAALYEIARRHPLICACHVGVLDFSLKRYSLHPIRFLGLYGLKSWPELSLKKRNVWQKVAGILKGVDCRDETEKCFSIESAAFSTIKIKRTFSTKKYQKLTIGKVSHLIEEDVIKNPPFMSEMESEIKEAAVKAFRDGYLLMAVAPDIATDNAESLMAKEFRQYRTNKGISKSRARWENWLPLISEFENATLRSRGAKSQLFVRYRRVIDGIEFP